MIFLAGITDVLGSFWPFLAMIPIFYFLIYRPQAQKQKKQKNFLDSLEKGDEIVTASGIVGRINKVEEGVVKLQVDNKTFLTITKGSISQEMSENYNKKNE